MTNLKEIYESQKKQTAKKQKSKNNIMIIVLGVLLIGMVVGIISYFSSRSLKMNTITIDVFENDTIEIVDNNEIEICGTEDSIITIQFYGKSINDYEIDPSDKKLTIVHKENNNRTTKISIPVKLFVNLKVTNNSEDIKIEDLDFKELIINNKSGDIGVYNCEIQSRILIENSSGGISLKNIEASNADIFISNESGDVDTYDLTLKTLSILTSSGNVGLDIYGKPEDYTLDLHSESGRITIDQSYDDFKGKRPIIVETISGNIHINVYEEGEN